MQVAEKQITSQSQTETIATNSPQQRASKAQRSRMPKRLIDPRALYEAKGDGLHSYEPATTPESAQPTPFHSLSWEQWQEVREQLARNLDRFVQAAQEQHIEHARNAGLEIQLALSKIGLEIYVMGTHSGLKDLPRRD